MSALQQGTFNLFPNETYQKEIFLKKNIKKIFSEKKFHYLNFYQLQESIKDDERFKMIDTIELSIKASLYLQDIDKFVFIKK